MGSGQVLSEFDQNGSQTARYDWAGDEPIRQDWNKITSSPAGPVTTSGSSFYLTDGLNSVRQLTDTNGNVTDSYSYDAWGNWAAGSGSTPNSYYFNAQAADAGGYYLRARYYNPAIGRFLSHDPLLGNDDDPVSLHRYLYAANDPVNHIDPSGQDAEGLAGVVATLSISAILLTQPQIANAPGLNDPVIRDSEASYQGRLANNLIMTIPSSIALGYGIGIVGKTAFGQAALNLLGRIVKGRAAAAGTPVTVNIGGEGEVANDLVDGTVINVRPGYNGRVNPQTGKLLAVEDATAVAEASGQPSVVAAGDRLPFADASVDRVVTNSVPVDKPFSPMYGASPTSSEIRRILKPGGEWVGDLSPNKEYFGGGNPTWSNPSDRIPENMEK